MISLRVLAPSVSWSCFFASVSDHCTGIHREVSYSMHLMSVLDKEWAGFQVPRSCADQ